MLPLPDDKRFEELKSGFCFSCHPGVPCFNECCRKLTLVLTPYDVLRLKNRLGISSGEFIDRYTEVESGQNGWPTPRLAMLDNERQTCPFVSEAGCTVYEDRPGACRSYPLGRGSKGGANGKPQEEFFFLVREDHCRGFEEGPSWNPLTWSRDQGIEEYNAWNDKFVPLITRDAPAKSAMEAQKKMRMMFMAAYNLDTFRDFITQTRMLQVFDLPGEKLRRALEESDEELLELAFDWLKFALFGEKTLKLKPEVEAAAKARIMD